MRVRATSRTGHGVSLASAAYGKTHALRGRDHTEDGVIIMGADYGFLNGKAKLGDEDAEEGTDVAVASPLLCGRDTYGWIFCHCLRSKGTEDECSTKMFTQKISLTGESNIIARSDGQPAILKLVQVSAAASRISDAVAVLTEQTPKGESKANG